MTRICREAEASLDYYAMFKNILKAAPMPMSPLESLASSAVRTAHKVRAAACTMPALLVCSVPSGGGGHWNLLTRGAAGSNACVLH